MASNDSNEAGNNPSEPKNFKKKGEDPHVAAARAIARCVDLSCDINKVIKIMQLLQQDEASKHGDIDETEIARNIREETLQKISSEGRENAIRIYSKIIEFAPNFRVLVEDLSRASELTRACTTISSNIKSTRSSDANRLKPCIACYCAPNPHDLSSLKPPILLTNGRAEMGLNHPVLTRWLRPADQLNIFDANPEQARQDLASGVMKMGSTDIPAFFWSGNLPGDDFDPENMCHRLFQSYYLIHIARHIFLGPSFAIESNGRKKRANNATLNNMITIEAEHIAYTSVLARFSISAKDYWSEVDGNFHYFDMYKAVIEFIKNAVPEWRDDLLKWWNVQLFGKESGQEVMVSAPAPARSSAVTTYTSTLDRLRAQMQVNLTTSSTSESFPLDPGLASESALSSVSTVPTSDMRQTEGPISAPAAPTTSDNVTPMVASSSPVTLASVSTEQGPTTPHHLSTSAIDPGTSPLTEEELSAPLTPLTNRKGKQSAKAKGKRPAPVNAEGDNATGSGSHPKKARRSRK